MFELAVLVLAKKREVLRIILIAELPILVQGFEVLIIEEGEVEHDLDEIGLNGVVRLILVVILDKIVTAFIKVWGEVLEFLPVLLACEDIIAMSTLNLPVLLTLWCISFLLANFLVLLKAVIRLSGEVQDLSSVAFLKNGPLEIVLINCLEVVRQALINFKATNREERNLVPPR